MHFTIDNEYSTSQDISESQGSFEWEIVFFFLLTTAITNMGRWLYLLLLLKSTNTSIFSYLNFANLYSLYWNFPCPVFALGWIFFFKRSYQKGPEKEEKTYCFKNLFQPFHWEALAKELMYRWPWDDTHSSEAEVRTE